MSALLKNESIKVLTSTRLIDYMPRRPTHLVSRMALNNSVINLCSASFQKRTKPGVISEKGWKTHCFYRLPFSRYKLIERINNIAYARFLKKYIKDNDIIWAYEPFSIDGYQECKKKLLVYELCDDTSVYFKNDKSKREFVLRQEEKVIRAADIVFTISDHLFKQKKQLNSNFYVVRNGADFSFFNKALQLKKTNKDEMSTIAPPIVGYHGAISPWIDFDLIEDVAAQLKNFNFVFIGRIGEPCLARIQNLSTMPNVFFLGEKKYENLIHYVKYFDVAIIPFIIDQLILSVNPIKMYEYLAAGKPILSTSLPEVQLYEEEGVIETSSDANDFACKIRKMYELRAEADLIEKRLALAFNNSWDERYKELERLVNDALIKKTK